MDTHARKQGAPRTQSGKPITISHLPRSTTVKRKATETKAATAPIKLRIKRRFLRKYSAEAEAVATGAGVSFMAAAEDGLAEACLPL